MSCVPSDPRFRLLDHVVGWDDMKLEDIAGTDESEGLRLDGEGAGLSIGDIDGFIPHPRLARGCGDCDWYLATPPSPQSRILMLDGCSNDWRSADSGTCFPLTLGSISALAHDRHVLALADRTNNAVWLMRAPGWQVLAEIPVNAPRAIALSEERVFILAEDGNEILVASRNGRILGTWPASLPAGDVERIAIDSMGLLWLVLKASDGGWELYRQSSKTDPEFTQQTLDQLAQEFDPTGLVTSAQGFCLVRGDTDGSERGFCTNWYGRPIEGAGGAAMMAKAAYALKGQFLSGAIDSGEPRCRWHRIRLTADIPANTSLEVAVSTSEEMLPAAQGVSDGMWAGFAPGFPHPDDWQVIPPGSDDALIQLPVGRYLFIRVRMRGDGSATPRLKQVRFDFPRSTSADLLPAVYREEPRAADFTERFMSLFDAMIEELETASTRFPALLDAARAPGEVLPWTASFLDLAFDESWDEEVRRKVLRAAPELYRKRGTLAGLRRALELVFGVDLDVLIEEDGAQRSWGAVASSSETLPLGARLGSIRLFSPTRSRMTLGSSPVGRVPIKSYGDPASDAHSAGAFRFTVTVPPLPDGQHASLIRLVEAMKPAHTLARIRFAGNSGFHLGATLQLGIDTLIRRPDPTALGAPDNALGRNSVLGGTPGTGATLGFATLTSSPDRCTEA